ncbi:MAG: hypothetical protein Q8L36_03375 [bacterium]|nr:hypothetical protein [bacterium]
MMYIPDRYRNRFTLGLYYAVRILTAAVFALFIWERDWESAFYTVLIFLMILAPSVLKKKYNLFLPFELDLALGAFVFLTLLLGWLNDFYGKFDFWDGALHFQSGFLLGVVGFVLVYLLNEQKKALNLSPGFVSFFAVCFSLAMSVFWEIFEFVSDSFWGTRLQESGLPDTMGDLIVNAIGVIIIAILGYFWMKRHSRIPFTPKFFAKYRERRRIKKEKSLLNKIKNNNG